jgi:hypothetical protein
MFIFKLLEILISYGFLFKRNNELKLFSFVITKYRLSLYNIYSFKS